MRWDRFFDDLEDQLASGWEAERAALDTEAERLRLSRVSLRDRLRGLVGLDRSAPLPSFEFSDGSLTSAHIATVGADWLALETPGAGESAIIAPLASITGIGMPEADLLRTARAASAGADLSERMTFGFVLRDLVRRRSGVTLHLGNGRLLTGTIDRAGVDHLDLALHDPGSPRRAADVRGFRVVPFAAIAWVRVEGRSSI